MKRNQFFILKWMWIFIVISSIGFQSCNHAEVTEAYLFSYFKGSGEDGLHLAYSFDGLNWITLNNDNTFLIPQVGEDKLMRDPCIIQGPDDYFHMVWTVSWKEKGIGYASLKDLINWSEQKYIPVMEHEPDARNCWAPELFYDKEQDLYLIYWATTIPGRFPETESLGDNGYNHRIYYTTTKYFEDFSEPEILYDRGFNVIDAVIVKTDSNYTMFLKDETRHPVQKNIRIATSKSLTGPYSEPSEKITQDWVEGPTAIKIGDQYHLYFDRYLQKKYGLIVSDDLINWKDLSNELTYPDKMRHGTVFKVTEPVLKKLLEM